MRRVLLAVAAVLLMLTPAGAQQAPRRVALIIANASYAGYRALPNAAVDVGLVETALRRVGFEVQKQADLGNGAMRNALGAFQSRAQGADVALIYYAGHGMEAGGKNWLIPTDARLATDAELDFQAIEANLVIRAAAGAKARIIVLDACRDNPFAARMRSTGAYRVTRTGGGGLSALDVQSARGTLLMYSAASGEVADDGPAGRGSPFARAFARWMPEPGIELRVAVGKVADAVFAETGQRQLPFTTTSLSGTEIFLAGAPARGAYDPRQAEVLYWSSCCAENPTAADLTDYLAKVASQTFPGTYADTAHRRLDEMRKRAPAATAAASARRAPNASARVLVGRWRGEGLCGLQTLHFRQEGDKIKMQGRNAGIPGLVTFDVTNFNGPSFSASIARYELESTERMRMYELGIPSCTYKRESATP